ncbi:MAG TPA: UbiA family prenyltransferase, partial [Gemmatimonadales bacterium]|nr:UbiA family prenyltransferase [Gemmatimonadales bacterium]
MLASPLLALTKPRIVMLVVLTVAAGFMVAPGAPGASAITLAHALIGTALVAMGTNALNQVAERDVDAAMQRTQARPLPAGRIGLRGARVFAWTASGVGVAYLAVMVNQATAVLAGATLV